MAGKPDGDLAGTTAVVTGSTSGIGEAVARALAARGASVVLNSVSSAQAGRALAAELPDACYVQGDVSVEDEARGLVTAALDRWGRLDILVNNAGWTSRIPHHDLAGATDEVWRRTLDVNLMGTWYATRAAATALRADGGGVVVNVSSMAGLRPSGSSIPYAVSKAALNHLTLCLANVLAPEVRVNAVAPGLVDTPWSADWTDLHEAVAAAAPLRRTAQPEDVAQACLALIGGGYVTGQVLAVEGGLLLR
ncbi:MAG TPA: glucose 1-dehydrogenase [Acidimicrobiales bacterium]|jgi:ketoreductase RED2|nr:glucose 1-dehydrogenase [Acidimicrobiales bacterium]